MENKSNNIFRNIVIGIWLVLIFPLTIASAQVVEGLPSSNFIKEFGKIALGGVLLSPIGMSATIGILLTLIYFTIVTSTVRFHAKSSRYGLLRRYSRIVVRKYRNSEPVGNDNRLDTDEYSKLISIEVPLSNIFIRLHAVSDLPRYEMTSEQIRRLEELRQLSHPTLEQRETRDQLLRVWTSQTWQEPEQIYEPANVNIEEVLQQLTVDHSGAVILGAPGSGKSTTMRWLAYQMAYASYVSWYHPLIHSMRRLFYLSRAEQSDESSPISANLAPKQTPILLKIEDYVKALNKHAAQKPPTQLSLQEFFIEYFNQDEDFKSLPKVAETLLQELKKGRCLLLFDGLDEVVSDELRLQVSSSIKKFVDELSDSNTRYFNRFIVTSRIVGYVEGEFAKYAHYTLQEFDDAQIKQFLTSWFPQANLFLRGRGGRNLTLQEKEQVYKVGIAQRDKLLESIRNNLSVSRLAGNPLTLTILALLQVNNQELPLRRIILYERVSTMFITSHRFLNDDKIELVEKILSCFAYQLQSKDRDLTETEVKHIASSTMQVFYERGVSDNEVEQFVEIARSSSGLFVESGLNKFRFMHRTFQEYFAALYLYEMPYDQLEDFLRQNCHSSIWHEPLLLLFAYISELKEDETTNRKTVNDLISIIISTNDKYEAVLSRNLLLRTNILIECNKLNIKPSVQREVATTLFDVYGDVFGRGHYTQIAGKIEELALVWLRRQNSPTDPLLEAWYNALCDEKNPMRQEGAVHLFASIASGLGEAKDALSKLLPPLIQLAQLGSFSYYPHNMAAQIFRTTAKPSSLVVTRYALVALRLLDENSLAGWLHGAWLVLNKERPKLLERLTKHSQELSYLLTPAAFPGKSDSENWRKQIATIDKWQELEQISPQNVQKRLLENSSASSYPLAYILKQVLEEEFSSSPREQWRDVWNKLIKEKMTFGESHNYQAYLYLRILIFKEPIKKEKEDEQSLRIAEEYKQQRRLIAVELTEAITVPGHKQKEQALIAIANMFWRKVRSPRYLEAFHEPMLRELEDLLLIRDLLDVHNLYLLYLHKLRERRNLRYLREQKYLSVMKNLLALDVSAVRKMWSLRNIRSIFSLIDISDEFDEEEIVRGLCVLLEKPLEKPQIGEQFSTILITLYSILLTKSSISNLYQAISKSIDIFTHWASSSLPLTREHSSLIITIKQLIEPHRESQVTSTAPLIQDSPDDVVSYIYRLRQDEALTSQQVKEIVLACLDTRKLSVEKQLQLYLITSSYLDTVQAAAWEILKQPFTLSSEAFSFMLGYMDKNDVVICAAIAKLSQHSKTLSVDNRQKIAEKIMTIMQKNKFTSHPIHQLDYVKLWKLDDVLYEALTALI